MSVWVGARLAVEILICSPSHLLPLLGCISQGLNQRLCSTSDVPHAHCQTVRYKPSRHTHLSSHNKNRRYVLSSRYCQCVHMNECTRVQQCKSKECGPLPLSLQLTLPNNSPPPAAKAPDYHFIMACHYSDAINGNELVDNWFTITVPSSMLALREPLVLIDSFLLSALSDWL